MKNNFFVIEWNTEGENHTCGCGFNIMFCGSKEECEEYVKNNCSEKEEMNHYYWKKTEYKIIQNGYSEIWE